MNEDVKDFIHNFPFKSLYKLWPEIKNRFPNTRKKDVEKYLKTRPKDKIPETNKKLQRKAYTNYIGGWQMDLLVSSKNQTPKKWQDGINVSGHHYFLICININTRYIYVSSKLNNKNTKTVLPAIKQFVETHKPLVIFSDNEAAFTSHEVVEYLVNSNVELKIITEQIHSTLGIINRACRTIRDMLNSNHIDENKLNNVVNVYNNSPHYAINMSPQYMMTHPDVEELYITNCILRDIGVITDDDYDIEINSIVRYVLDKKSREKTRHKISTYAYKIDSKEGNNYVISAKDGTTKKVPRYRLIPVKDNEQYNLADTLEEYNANRGVVEEILDYNHKAKKYKVKFTVPDAEPYTDWIPVRNMRESAPTRLSKLEREYFNKNKDKYTVKGIKIEPL